MIALKSNGLANDTLSSTPLLDRTEKLLIIVVMQSNENNIPWKINMNYFDHEKIWTTVSYIS